ncbi:hypothetical protein ACFE04_003817 [Oxalis oulophora]
MEGTERPRTSFARSISRGMSRGMSRANWGMEEVFASGRENSRRNSQLDEDEEALKWAAIERLPTYNRLRTSVIQSYIDNQHPPVPGGHEADCYIGTRALPTLPNVARNIGESALGMVGIRLAKRKKLTILQNTSGIIKPSRMTLLLGPPSSGKTTLLLALAGKLDPNLKVELLSELARREKDARIFPDAEVDLFMKATAMEGIENSLITDYTLKVTSKKDQEQYWACENKPYHYISVTEFSNRFKRFHVGMRLENELSVPYDKSRGHRASLVFKKYAIPKLELLKACWDKEWLLIKRNSFVYVFKSVQILITAFVASTVFLRTEMKTKTENDGAVYIGALLFSLISNMFNGFAELSLTIKRLPVFYKQRDLLFHPAWTFTLPTFLLQLPISVVEATVWMGMTYFSIGFAPEASRFFKQFLLVFLVQQMAAGAFRLIAGVCRTMIIANTGGALTLLLIFLLGGFILPKNRIPDWWSWGYWFSPLTYGYNAIAVNEMFAPRWMNQLTSNATGTRQAIMSEDDSEESSKLESREMLIRKTTNRSDSIASSEAANGIAPKRGMVLPFTALAMSFDSVNYYVDMPALLEPISTHNYRRNKALVKELSTPPPGAKDLHFNTQYSQSPWGQFKSCLWKQWWTYWRSPDYNLVRYSFTLAAALMVGTIFWRVGKKK